MGEGTLMMRLSLNGRPAQLKIKSIHASEVELTSDLELPAQFNTFGLNFNGKQFYAKVEAGRMTLPSKALWHCPAIITEVIGYDLTTDLWHDPIAFLRQHHAHTQPAKLRLP